MSMDDKGEDRGCGPEKVTMIDDCCSEQSYSTKISHKQWRARLKRERRRQKRQEHARQSAANTGTESLEVEIVDEEFEKLKQQRDEAERAYLHSQWLEREKQAQGEWKRKKERERVEKQKREEQEKKIREEWEEQQRKEKEEQEQKDQKDKEKKSRQEDLLRQATANENKDGDDQPWHNPIVRVVQGKERDKCPFFAKTAACRFGDRCSRTHPQTESSTTLLFRSMYSHFELEQGLMGEEYDTDLILEYDDSELYQNFREFYEDIVPEFKAIGQVVQVKVCCNYEPHLRGNVYIQYRREDDAASAFVQFNGRFYGGKQLSCEYVTIVNWKSAICGLFGSGRCPKGRNCNFLHVFKNPGNEFWEADRYDRYKQSNSQSRNREWSERSSNRRRRNSSRSRERRRSRSRSRERRRSRSRERRSRSRSRERRSRSRSRERRSRSRSRERRSRSRERSRSRSRERRSRSPYGRRSNRSRSSSKDKLNESNRKRSRSRSKTRDRFKSRKKHSASRSLSRGRSRSPKSKKKHSNSRSHSRSKKRSFSRSLSGGRTRSPLKSKYQNERKDSKVEDICAITDNIAQSEKKLVSKCEGNVERLANNRNEQVLEIEQVRYDIQENSSDSEKLTQNHHHKDKKHKKKHKHKKHKVTLEWVEAS